jgi:hypothetical protein
MSETSDVSDMINSEENFTTYRTEQRAYHVGSYIAQSLGENRNANGIEYWNEGWSASELETKRANGINKIVEKYYGATRHSQGRRLMEFK